ncbi:MULTISPECIES: cyclodeaminase/cyclohydrolase family protein [unclassified Rhizobacter]|uniref:cyclodeaminase/cyclohydrolase family protein n=1 Tax=unclassified Rhizobacter TaxID=2640088 RepID=UPI0009E6AA63|nr:MULTISPECIES: cyclodeaminase/cyclohydrolase family protein [unclassified Rhizobacter]
MQSLLDLSTNDLLAKFGMGGHAPGSGSAAALKGLLAAELIVTVGVLTLKKSKYLNHHPWIKDAVDRVQNHCIPTLKRLFQEDADTFDGVIKARISRDNEPDPEVKARLDVAAGETLKEATAIPFRIADVCVELIGYAAGMFDSGFRAARGDSGAAFSAAIAGTLSAVFIINLNLIKFNGTYWARQQQKRCDELQRKVSEQHQKALARITYLRTEALADHDPTALVGKIFTGSKARYTRRDIDTRVADVQRLVWGLRDGIWLDGQSSPDAVSLLDPEIALRRLGYRLEEHDSLGVFRSGTDVFEVAGLLESDIGRVRISAQMNPNVRRFTAAHELGHVVLHPHLLEAHRDRPLDGSTISKASIELEADRFASSYLMPANLVRTRFMKTFGSVPFVLSEEAAFALVGTASPKVHQVLRSRRGLARTLAAAVSYNGQQLISLAAQFKVSIEALAIRLEELGLVAP